MVGKSDSRRHGQPPSRRPHDPTQPRSCASPAKPNQVCIGPAGHLAHCHLNPHHIPTAHEHCYAYGDSPFRSSFGADAPAIPSDMTQAAHFSSVDRSPASVTKSVLVFIVLVVTALAADLMTKRVSWQYFVANDDMRNGRVELTRNAGADDVVVASNLLELTAVANQGAAMGLGQGRKALFLTVSGIATIVLIGFYVHSLRTAPMYHRPGERAGDWRARVYRGTLAILLAGVLGNFYDRMVFGYVRDMFHMFPEVPWSSLNGSLPDAPIFPWVFNLADVYLCAGVGMILFFGLFAPPENMEEPTPDTADPTATTPRP